MKSIGYFASARFGLFIVAALLVTKPAFAAPVWKRQFVAFNEYGKDAGPWRSDPRIQDRFHREYPDDLQVRFPVIGGQVPNELMWVTVIDYDKETDTYLGKLLNKPDFLKNLDMQDNIVFSPIDSLGMPVALQEDNLFWAPAVPSYARRGIGKQLYDGVREYRLGNFGHNMSGIKKCLSILKNVSKQAARLSQADAYLAHFALGRCAAEAYDTKLAIESFRSAVQLRPADLYANMSLLAEYSIAVFHPDIQPKEQWELAFTQQLEFVRTNFANDKQVEMMLKTVFDETKLANASTLSDEQKARGRKFGFGTLRWKAR